MTQKRNREEMNPGNETTDEKTNISEVNIDDETSELLYSYIETASTNAETDMLKERISKLQKKCISLVNELAESQRQIQHINNEKMIVEKNMISLYHTALLEIERKDKQLQELMREQLRYNR